MNAAAGLLALLLAAQPAAAAFISSLAADPLRKASQSFQGGHYRQVIADLSPETMQKLGGEKLAQAYLYLGRSFERVGRLDLALGVYQVSTRMFPKDINLLTQLGLLLHHAGLEEQAQPVFDDVLAIHPNNAVAHQGLAEIDASLGLLDASVGHYQKALQILGGKPGLWRDYGQVLYRKRDFAGAEAAARKSLALAPSASGFITLAMVQRAEGRGGDAVKTLDSAMSLEPGRSDLRLLRAAWQLELGRWPEALAGAQAALAQDPREPLALWIRARVALKRGDEKAARADLALAAQCERRSPFVAHASAALLKELRKGRR